MLRVNPGAGRHSMAAVFLDGSGVGKQTGGP
jgi:hypothetical protein